MTPKEDSFEPLIRLFRSRAKALRRNALVNLVIIITLLTVGIAVFILAGTLANRESSQAVAKEQKDKLGYLKTKQIDLQMQLRILESEITDSEKKLMDERVGTGRTGSPGEGPLYKFLDAKLSSQRAQRDDLKAQLNDVDRQKDDLQDQITKVEASKQSPAFSLDRNQVWVLVSAIATRIGSIVLLLFLVKILVPLYRYNMRLASYYDARGDALELMLCTDEAPNEIRFQNLTEILTPERVEFGESPNSPTDQAFELAKQLVKAQSIK